MSLFLALIIRAGRITPRQEIVQPICSPFHPALGVFCKETRADLWVNHSLFILRIHYSQCRMGQASPMVLFCSLTRWHNFLNWTTINGAAFTTQWGILLLVCGSLSLPAAAGTGMKNSPKYSKVFEYQVCGIWI